MTKSKKAKTVTVTRLWKGLMHFNFVSIYTTSKSNTALALNILEAPQCSWCVQDVCSSRSQQQMCHWVPINLGSTISVSSEALLIASIYISVPKNPLTCTCRRPYVTTRGKNQRINTFSGAALDYP